MTRGQPRQKDRENVFGGAEGDVGKRFGGRRYARAQRGLAAVGSKSDAGREGNTGEMPLGRELAAGGVSEKGSDRNTNERVNRVPEKIEVGDFVGEEFEDEKYRGDGNDAPILQESQVARECDGVEAAEESQCRDRGVNVEASGKAGGDDQRDDLGGGEGHRQF